MADNMNIYPYFSEEANTTVAYVEWGESPTEGFDENNHFYAHRILRCEWEHRIALMRALMGGNYLNRDKWVGPAYYPWTTEARVIKVDCSPYPTGPSGRDELISAPGASAAEHKYAFLSVDYGVIERYKWSYTTSAEYLTKKAYDSVKAKIKLFWETLVEGKGIPLLEGDVINTLSPITKMELTVNVAPTLPVNLEVGVGFVNSITILGRYLPLGRTAPASGTLLYLGGEYSQSRTTRDAFKPDAGLPDYEPWVMKLKFAYKYQGWNRFFRPGESTPERIYTDETAREPVNEYDAYAEANHNTLLEQVLGEA